MVFEEDFLWLTKRCRVGTTIFGARPPKEDAVAKADVQTARP